MSFIKIFRKPFYFFYWKARGLIVPDLRSSQYFYKDKLKSYVNQNSQWLDLGCGRRLFPEYIRSSEEEQDVIIGNCNMIVGIDGDYISLYKNKIKNKIVGDIQKLPFKDKSFNLITSNMVVEHIEKPFLLLTELSRILKPDGVFIFHTPNLLNYQTFIALLIPELVKNKLIGFFEGRKEEDVYPAYYRMNTLKKIKDLAKVSGFNLYEIKVVNSTPKTIMLGPVVIIELFIIRVLNLKLFRSLRSNLIAVFRR